MDCYIYAVEKSLDSYKFNLLHNKQVFINQLKNRSRCRVSHMLSTILAKVNNIEKLLSPAVENIPDSEILDSKGVRLLTKMSDRTLLRRRNDGTLPFYRDNGKIYYRRSDVLRAVLLEKTENSKK